MNIAKLALLAAAGLVAMAVSATAADMIGNCEVTGKKGSFPIEKPAKAGQFTVETNLPGPVWWNGDTPETIKDGMEYCMAAEIAWRAGYDKLVVANTDWDPLIAGQTHDFDVAFSQISITDERKKVHDFSTPYFNSDIGVLARADAPVDADSIKKVKVGVQQSTTGMAFATDKLGLTNTQVYPDQGSMFAALRAKQIDAAITDTSIVLAQEVESKGGNKVVGQYQTGETYGGIYQKGNPNNPIIDKIIQSMKDDGTITKLGAKYLAASWGKDPASVPVWKP
ncbi:ABC transporter substrate-binding protein [Aestuariivirga litoralis]|uniref:ABC transporter substrate-binding protein n=1 Tax=Aestuariivirga litoralis TaxID=2650924 RepID=UPI0018C50C43|nr:ABC transporter substrate-binding protein [Aestuariivirga litoralis]MBG1232004.1 amino acid ABC transporter substrate-binding protein [Aestuariivirga litoralis]